MFDKSVHSYERRSYILKTILQCYILSESDVNATIFVAMAARDRDSDTIYIEANERRVLDAYVRLVNKTDFTSVDFTQASTWTYSGVV